VRSGSSNEEYNGECTNSEGSVDKDILEKGNNVHSDVSMINEDEIIYHNCDEEVSKYERM